MPTTQPDGYLALPPSGEGNPVLVLHAWWGLNDILKVILLAIGCRRFRRLCSGPLSWQGR